MHYTYTFYQNISVFAEHKGTQRNTNPRVLFLYFERALIWSTPFMGAHWSPFTEDREVALCNLEEQCRIWIRIFWIIWIFLFPFVTLLSWDHYAPIHFHSTNMARVNMDPICIILIKLMAQDAWILLSVPQPLPKPSKRSSVSHSSSIA